MNVELIFIGITVGYCLFTVFLLLGWERISIVSTFDTKPSVAVLLPVRNEEENILNLLKDLTIQSYAGHLRIIVINDHSNDSTEALVSEYIKDNPTIKLINSSDGEGKKQAITKGVKYSESEIILTIDGDCRAPNTWVETMVGVFSEQTQIVSGPVKICSERGFFSKLQSIEFASLIGSGASLIGWGKPIMANGANLAFRRVAFLTVKGFDGNEGIASGDDVFLLHKIAKKYPASVVFAKQEGAIITTNAQPTLSAFVAQRIRWASKWPAYSDPLTKITAVAIFSVSLLFVVFPFLVLFQKTSLFLWSNLLIIKAFFDFFFLRQITQFFNTKLSIFSFIFLQLIYPFYIVYTSLFSFKKTYAWKGRLVK